MWVSSISLCHWVTWLSSAWCDLSLAGFWAYFSCFLLVVSCSKTILSEILKLCILCAFHETDGMGARPCLCQQISFVAKEKQRLQKIGVGRLACCFMLFAAAETATTQRQSVWCSWSGCSQGLRKYTSFWQSLEQACRSRVSPHLAARLSCWIFICRDSPCAYSDELLHYENSRGGDACHANDHVFSWKRAARQGWEGSE